jgi:ProP effector
MSNASLKDQLQAVASQLTVTETKHKGAEKEVPVEKRSSPQHHVTKNKKPKPVWLDYVQYGVELLRVYFPNCFMMPGKTKPLKKGIKQDLVTRLSTIENIATDDKACMVKSLSYYVNTVSYLRNVTDGTPRVGLDGEQVDVVTAEEAKYSLERQQAKHDAKKASSKQQTTAVKEPVEIM